MLQRRVIFGPCTGTEPTSDVERETVNSDSLRLLDLFHVGPYLRLTGAVA